MLKNYVGFPRPVFEPGLAAAGAAVEITGGAQPPSLFADFPADNAELTNVIKANYPGNPNLPATFITYGIVRDPTEPPPSPGSSSTTPATLLAEPPAS